MERLNTDRGLLVCNLGLSRYSDAWELQRKLFQLKWERKISDLLLLTEHLHVYTIGKTGTDRHLLVSKEELETSQVEVYHIDRGGDITYHGPGQLVAYPILDLENFYRDVHRYLRDLEEVIIRTLRGYGISGERDPEYTGVWVNGKKIAAIGVKVSRWITMHGVAVNVNTDLDYFHSIVPCGITKKGVTSLEEVLSQPVELNEFADSFVESFGKVFNVRPTSSNLDDLLGSISHHRRVTESCPE